MARFYVRSSSRERPDRLGPARSRRTRVSTFGTLKSILKVPFFAAVIVLTVIAYRHYGILGGVAMLIVGTPVLMGVFSLVVVLPLGYAFCGRDAMRLGQQLMEARDRGLYLSRPTLSVLPPSWVDVDAVGSRRSAPLRRMAAVTLVVGFVLAACSRGSSTVSVARMNSDSAIVDTNLTAYQNLNNQSLTSVDQLRTFATTVQTDLTTLRAAFDVWSHDLDHVNQSQASAISRTAYPSMLAYRDALNDWLTEQSQETTASAACLNSGSDDAVLQCYQQLIDQYILDPDRQQFERRPRATAISTRPMTTPKPTRASAFMGRPLRS